MFHSWSRVFASEAVRELSWLMILRLLALKLENIPLYLVDCVLSNRSIASFPENFVESFLQQRA